MYNVVVIDDELLSLEIIENLCSRFKFLNVISKFNKSLEGFDFVENNEVDLIILDVEMPFMNGVDFVMNLSRDIPVIVVSSEKKYAFDFIKYEFILGYLHKPLNENKFEEMALKFLHSKEKNTKSQIVPFDNKYLFINQNKSIKRITLEDVYVIEARADYVYIKTIDKNFITKSSLKNILEKLPSQYFFRVHKSFVVNMTKISEINQGIIVVNNEHIPLSKANSKSFFNKINCL